MPTPLERKLLICTALVAVAVSISAIVLVFRIQEAAVDALQRANINRYLICQILVAMGEKQTICDDIDPPPAAHPKRLIDYREAT